MAQLSPLVKQRFFLADGLSPLIGGKLYTYEAGTSTPKATYQDSVGLVPNTNPIIMDSKGECDLWIDAGFYKFILTDADDVVQWSVDNISRQATGPQGASFLAGSGAPTEDVGEDNDTYLDYTSLLFYTKTDGTWDLNGGSIASLAGLTGDVVATGPGTATATIQSNAVTNTKLNDMDTQTFKGRLSSGTGDPEDLTVIQVTAMLNSFVGDSGSGGVKGLVPAPSAGDASTNKVLGANGSWVDGGFIQSSHAFTAGQSDTDLTGETVDSAVYTSAVYEFEIIRGTTIFANGRIALQYLNSTWRIADGGYLGEEHGLTWSLSGTTTAQLRVAANAGSNGTIKFKKVFYAA